MQTASSLLSLFLILLSYSGRTNGLCILENGTTADCYELEDVKYIETYDLESLKASVSEPVLQPGFFGNLSSLRHLDLSGGNLERIKPGSFHDLVNLRSLNLAENRIQYLDLGSIDGLNHLHSLNLRKNNLRLLPPAVARLKVLKHLDIQGNPIDCNCATLKVRDLIVKRGVKISKKIVCVSPSYMKGTSLFKPDATIVCNFEEQDREMQRDQGYGAGEEFGSGDDLEGTKEDDEEDQVEEKNEEEEAKEKESAETPFPEILESSTSTTEATSADISVTSQESTSSEGSTSSGAVEDSVEKSVEKDEKSSFDIDEGKEQTSTMAPVAKRKEFQDALYYPVEGSGDEEGSGEGSGTGALQPTGTTQETNDTDDDLSFTNRFLSPIVGILFGTTKPAEPKKEIDLEGEEFLDVSSATTEVDQPKKVDVEETTASFTEISTNDTTLNPTDAVKLINRELTDSTEEETQQASAKQSKKGMGSYVVLAALLTILATLIGFAAYKGDFCKKKRKRGDVEKGTELKDMQKALLDTGNSTQPKIASNGTVENAPLVEDSVDHEERKEPSDNQSADVSKSPNGTADRVDPVKPPRRTASPQDDRLNSETNEQDASSVNDNSLSARRSFLDPVTNNGSGQLSDVNGPPLSPGAQRVKITLQENPDSVPRTPILITRTMAGENLVKTKPGNTEE